MDYGELVDAVTKKVALTLDPFCERVEVLGVLTGLVFLSGSGFDSQHSWNALKL